MNYGIQNDVLTVCLHEDIDHASVTRLRPWIEDLIQKHRPRLLTLDFADVDFMDSAGIGFVIGRYKSMRKSGGCLKIVNAKSKVTKILHMACIEQLVEIR